MEMQWLNAQQAYDRYGISRSFLSRAGASGKVQMRVLKDGEYELHLYCVQDIEKLILSGNTQDDIRDAEEVKSLKTKLFKLRFSYNTLLVEKESLIKRISLSEDALANIAYILESDINTTNQYVIRAKQVVEIYNNEKDKLSGKKNN